MAYLVEYTLKETSKIFKVSESVIKSLIKQFKEIGMSGPRKHKKIDPVKQYPDAYLHEMVEYFT